MITKNLYHIYLKHPLIDTDTRKIRKGSIFFALKGENFNANEFAAEALKKGAAYVVTDEETDTPPQKTIRRQSVLLALQQLAAEHRKHLQAKIIAITGTNGKTTTKELTNAVLSKKYKTYATKGNFNNHIGVPLTLLAIPPLAEMAIIEMGANHPGEIAELCRIADPDIGIITNIGKAHLEGFGSEEGVFKTKKSLFDHIIKKQGPIFFLNEEPWLSQYKEYPNAMIYGTDNETINGRIITSDPTITVKLKTSNNDQAVTLKTNLFGEHNLFNVLAATAIGSFFDVGINEIVAAIASYEPSNNRSQVEKKERNILIMDAYNANPTSMSSALRSFASGTAEKKAVILGDMLELGQESQKEHLAIIKQLKENDFQLVILVGNEFMSANHNKNYHAFADVIACEQFLAAEKIEGYTILIKGSRGVKLELLKIIL